MTGDEACSILTAALAALGQSPPSSFTVRSEPNGAASNPDWWSERMKPGERSETPRTLGYLRGYAAIAGDGLLLATGLPLTSGKRLWMDRSVMKRLERDGYLRWSGQGARAHFEITPRGALWMAGDGR